MKKIIFTAAALIVGIGASHAAGSIKWLSSFDKSLSMAKHSHRLVMIDFYTDWCEWCKKLDKDVYVSTPVVAESKGFVPVKLNAEKEGKTAATKYHVNVFPTIIFAKPNGDLAWKIVGYLPPADFAKQMKMATGVETVLPGLESKFKSTPSPTLATQLIAYYAGMAALDKLQSVVTKLEKTTPTSPSAEYGDAFNAAGDAYQSANQLPLAIATFKKAETVGKPKQEAYARISLAQCYNSSNDQKSEVSELKSVVAMGAAAGQFKTQAEQRLAEIQKGG